ncbi:MAG: hypothetical protein ACREGL_08020, partial [Alphaproteobacteria bacterium]
MARSSERQRYRLCAPLSRARLARSLGAGLRLGAARCDRLERTWLDTFDWRIFCADGALVLERAADGGPRLVWRRLSSGEALVELNDQPAPRFA